MFKNCLILLVLFTTVVCQEIDELDELDEEVLRELQENQKAQVFSNGLLKADDKQFDGKFIYFCFIIYR
jgi:hypothetical protein